ncbi:transcriptional repressor LexA [Caloramator sp. E03]|uniref:transcriptional repressor LexA n=1 Tax=Caloramator sp. E03 TaxID=2576307 RepID=UPI00111094FE|nr:transcriptional repressor LexA [Caloramator sp. E03]QCX32311.1 transcriptional repressor LexA [Caloramator sp. E03]
MINNDLSDKQQEILDFIKHEISIKGYPPSVREICSAVGLKSTSTVHGHLAKLEKKGYIRRDPTKPRAIEILDDRAYNKEIISVPIVGSVAAGTPILAVENIEDTFPLPTTYFSNKNNLFMLQIKGDSMIGSGILDGDYIIIEQQSTAIDGDIVVALVDDSATVKRFYKEKDYIRLQPENPALEPIIVKDCKILGKAIGLFRKIK